MRRSPLTRRAPLRQNRALRALSTRTEPTRVSDDERAEQRRADAYKRSRRGSCQVCGAKGWVRRHHVVREQHVRRDGGDPWDMRNALWVGLGSESGRSHTCDCHRRHHDAVERIPVDVLPAAAIEFTIELMGPGRAALYLAREYAPPTTEGESA